MCNSEIMRNITNMQSDMFSYMICYTSKWINNKRQASARESNLAGCLTEFVWTGFCVINHLLHWASVCDWLKVEQRVEPAKKAAQLIHKKLQCCMQSQSGLEAEKRMVQKHLCPSHERERMVEDCYVHPSCFYRKSFHWCCCPSAWQRVSKTLMQSRPSGKSHPGRLPQQTH